MRLSTPVVVALVTNGLILVGLVFLGWSVWTAVAIYWLEAILHAPAHGWRLRQALPSLSDDELEAYLQARDREFRNGRSSGSRIREALAAGGREAAARAAGWEVVKFWGGLTAVMCIFLFVGGGAAGARSLGLANGFDLGLFDWGAIALGGAVVAASEAATLYLDRRPSMAELGAYARRATAIFLVAILAAVGFVDGSGSVVLACGFVVLRLLVDLRSGRHPDDRWASRRFPPPARPTGR
jgi:hypothetical protein